MYSNEFNLVELKAKLGRIKVNRDLNALSVGALTLVGTTNYLIMLNGTLEETVIESGFFLLGAVGFGINAVKKNKKVKILQKQINKLQTK